MFFVAFWDRLKLLEEKSSWDIDSTLTYIRGEPRAEISSCWLSMLSMLVGGTVVTKSKNVLYQVLYSLCIRVLLRDCYRASSFRASPNKHYNPLL